MPESICVIGCGPGGMFFCHALEQKRRELEKSGDTEKLANLPTITVFERAAGPGGVWRSERHEHLATTLGESTKEDEKKEEVGVQQVTAGKEEKTTQMYEALWTNGPKEGIEFVDYTFGDHFKRALPVYVPRQTLLEYMVARVTHKCPDFFKKYNVQFQTTVKNVKFDDASQNFCVKTQTKWNSGSEQTHTFDRCIWSAGVNGIPRMPRSVLKSLHNFTGTILHSTDAQNFEANVRGKRIAMIGGSYSAEDLALMATRLGAEEIFVVARADDAVVSWTGEWIDDRVNVMGGYAVVGVEGCSTLVVQKTEWIPGSSNRYRIPEDGDAERLENIETVILCTGYDNQFAMLDHSLSDCFDDDTLKFDVPHDFEIDPDGSAPFVGTIPPPEKAKWSGSTIPYPGVYRGLLVKNPRMAFLRADRAETPILEVDTLAWQLMQFYTGSQPIPAAKEMQRTQLEQALHEMKNYPFARYYMDEGYATAIAPHYKTESPHYKEISAIFDAWQYEWESVYSFQLTARELQDANHPLCLGTYEALNEKGKALAEYGMLSYYHRENATSDRTFRDTTDADKFQSIFTGTSAVPLKKLWMEIDEHEDADIV